jgi:DNA-binding transcriptional LysR family regulator
MKYTIHQLRIFLKVTHTQSITKAATELFMTQPAVSIQLKNFQDQFDIPLTEVIGRKLHITDFGKSVAEIAEHIIQKIEEIEQKQSAYKGLLSGKLRISSASTGKYVIPYFLNDFLEQNHKIDLELDVTNKSRVIKSLQNNEIDFALISVMPEQLPAKEEILLDNKLYLMGIDSIRSKSKPLIYRESGSATRLAMEDYFRELEGEKRKRMELTSNEAVKQAVLAGLGQSVMPLIGMKNELVKRQIHIIPAPGFPIITKWRLIWLKWKIFSPVSQAFLEYIRNNKAQILEKHFSWYLSFEENKCRK